MTDFKPQKRWFQGKKLTLAALLSAVLILMTGFVWKQNTVYIVADGKQYEVETTNESARSIVRGLGIRLGVRDEIVSSTETIENGTILTVKRIVPVRFSYQGKTTLVHTEHKTVGDTAAALGHNPMAVRTFPAEETAIMPGMEIRLVDYKELTVERQEAVPYNIVRQPDPNLERGIEEVVQQGMHGTENVTVKQQYHDGLLAKEIEIGRRRHAEPRDHIIRTGTRDTVSTSRGSMRFVRTYYMEASAYLPTDGGGHGITATGMRARHGVVAVDPDVIPLGSRLYIPGYGEAIAADTGGMIVGHRIDLCMESYHDAIQFGRRTIKVYLLE